MTANTDATPAFCGRPRSDGPRSQVTMRLDADLPEGLRATHAGWQTRINKASRSEQGTTP